MSDAEAPSGCVTPERPKVNKQAFLAAFEAKGCTTDLARAQLLGVTRKSVYRYLAGEVTPLLPTARKIASRLEVDIDELWPAA